MATPRERDWGFGDGRGVADVDAGRKLAPDLATELMERVEKSASRRERIEARLILLRRIEASVRIGWAPSSEEAKALAETARSVACRIDEKDRAAWIEAALLVREIESTASNEAPSDEKAFRGVLKRAAAALEANVSLREAHAAFALGRAEAWLGRPGRAARAMANAMANARGPSARTVVGTRLIDERRKLGQWSRLKSEAGRILADASDADSYRYAIGRMHRAMAAAFARRGRWRDAVESARRSNFVWFAFGASQEARPVGLNYLCVAEGMAELREYPEAMLLAGLSLRALKTPTPRPGKLDALTLLAEMRARLGDREEAARIARAVAAEAADAGLDMLLPRIGRILR